jgi:hypothetical protein
MGYITGAGAAASSCGEVLATADTLNAGDIATRKNTRKPCLGQQLAAAAALIVSVLECEPAAGIQVAWGAGHDLTYAFEPIGAGSEGCFGFEGQVAVCEMRVIGGDVRRVGYDQVEALTR